MYDSGAGLEEDHQDHNDDIYYAELTEQESQEGRDKVRSGSCSEPGLSQVLPCLS